MSERILGEDLLTASLEHRSLPADGIVQGAPTAAVLALGELSGVGGVEVGVWEMTIGTARDTEVDEIFVVLEGEGRVDFEDGSMLELRPGTAVRLRAGEQTVWTIHSTLRKLYVAG